MFHLFGIFSAEPTGAVPSSEAPFKQVRFGEASAPSDHAAYSKAESDVAFLTCKCHEPVATPERDTSRLRFVELFKPPYF